MCDEGHGDLEVVVEGLHGVHDLEDGEHELVKVRVDRAVRFAVVAHLHGFKEVTADQKSIC